MVDFIRCFHKLICVFISVINVLGIACIAIGKFVLGNNVHSIFSNAFVEFSMITSFVGIVIVPVAFVILLLNGIFHKSIKLIVSDAIFFIPTVSVMVLFLSCLTLWIGI